MKVVCIVPIKKNSKRIKGKNFKKIGGKPLYMYLLDKLTYTNFDEVYVDSDSKEIKNYCKKKGYKYLPRLPKLAKDNANGNDLLNYHSSIIKADLYFQLFITSPLMKVSTINNCIKILSKEKKYDSILTSQKIYSWFWFNLKPVNYSPKILPRSQDALPIVQETTGLYGIRREVLLKRKCRIGFKPFFYQVNDFENIDIDTLKDLNHLKYLIQNFRKLAKK